MTDRNLLACTTRTIMFVGAHYKQASWYPGTEARNPNTTGNFQFATMTPAGLNEI